MAVYPAYAVYVRGLVAAIVLAMVYALGRAPLQDRAVRRLRLFLVVVGAGFALETVWTATHATGLPIVPVGRAARVLQLALGLVDSLLLLWFALGLWPLRPHQAALALVGPAAACVAVAVAASTAPGGVLEPDSWAAFAREVYLLLAYAAAFCLVAARLPHERLRLRRRQLFHLALAVGFITFSRAGFFFTEAGPSWWHDVDPRLGHLLGFLIGAILGGVPIAALAGRHPAARAVLAELALVGALLLAAFAGLLAVADAIGRSFAPRFDDGAVLFGLRWVLFGLLVSHGILRAQFYDLRLEARHLLALCTALAAALVVATAGATWLEGRQDLVAARAVGLAAGCGTAMALYPVTKALLRRLPAREGVDPARSRETYEAIVEAFGGAGSTPDERRYLEVLRKLFDISPGEHEAIVQRLEAARGPG